MFIQSFLRGDIRCGGTETLRDSGARRALLFEGAAGGKMGAAEGAVKVGTEASIMSSSSSFAFLEGGCFDDANSEEVSMGWESVSVMSASSKSEGSVYEEETGAMTPGFLCSFLRFFRLTDGWEVCGEHATTIFQGHWEKKYLLLICVTCVTPTRLLPLSANIDSNW